MEKNIDARRIYNIQDNCYAGRKKVVTLHSQFLLVPNLETIVSNFETIVPDPATAMLNYHIQELPNLQ